VRPASRAPPPIEPARPRRRFRAVEQVLQQASVAMTHAGSRSGCRGPPGAACLQAPPPIEPAGPRRPLRAVEHGRPQVSAVLTLVGSRAGSAGDPGCRAWWCAACCTFTISSLFAKSYRSFSPATRSGHPLGEGPPHDSHHHGCRMPQACRERGPAPWPVVQTPAPAAASRESESRRPQGLTTRPDVLQT
jgi:hypothetical protein